MPESFNWYSPNEITFKPVHMEWLIENLPTLKAGRWPVDPWGTDSAIKAAPSGRAYFQTPIEYAAETERRLEDCGLDGLLVKLVLCYKETPDAVAKYYRIPPHVVSSRVTVALSYVSGWKYRTGRYRRWNASRKEKGRR